MISIPQHGADGALHDIAAFLPILDRYCAPDAWTIRIYACMGPGALEIERRSLSGLTLSDTGFRALYAGIWQTIDGDFTLLRDGIAIATLVALDSTCWEIAGPADLESHLLTTFGACPPAQRD